jgi:Tfp pilus assembly protein PilN
MATTLVPPTGTPRPTPPTGRRFVSVRANLLPEEVIHGRQALVMRKRVFVALGALAAVIVAVYGLSWWQTSAARSDLQDMQHRNAALMNQQNEFRPVVEAQSGAAAIQSQLHGLMAGDLSWNTLLSRVAAVAPAGISISEVDGQVTAATAGAPNSGGGGAAAGAGSLNQSGKAAVGTVTFIGAARDKNSVAAFADRLARVPGLTAPLISSVVTAQHEINFSIDVVITSDALGGRYSTGAAPTGGK